MSRDVEVVTRINWTETSAGSVEARFARHNESKRLAIVLHGHRSHSARSNVANTLADTLYAEGCDVIMFTSKADTITTMEADLKTVVAWAKGQAFPEGRFILAGHSLGAMTAMKYAHDYPEHIEMVIPVAPTISKKIAGEVGSLNDDEVTALGDVDLIALAPTILSQVLLIVGDSDPKTPADTQEKLFGLLGSAEKGLHIITTKDTSAPANHSLRNKPNVEALRKIVSQGIRGTLTNEH